MALVTVCTAEDATLSVDVVSGNVTAVEVLAPTRGVFVEVVNPGGNTVLSRTFDPQAAPYRTNVPNNRRAPWDLDTTGWTVRFGTL